MNGDREWVIDLAVYKAPRCTVGDNPLVDKSNIFRFGTVALGDKASIVILHFRRSIFCANSRTLNIMEYNIRDKEHVDPY